MLPDEKLNEKPCFLWDQFLEGSFMRLMDDGESRNGVLDTYWYIYYPLDFKKILILGFAITYIHLQHSNQAPYYIAGWICWGPAYPGARYVALEGIKHAYLGYLMGTRGRLNGLAT